MSKLYSKYLEKKLMNREKCYLFKSGMFYIFLDEDAKKIHSITLLSLTNLTNDIVKCGFPQNSLEKYINIFKNLNIEVEIVEDDENKIKVMDTRRELKVIKKIKSLNIDTISPFKALTILKELRNILDEWFRRIINI